MVAQSLLQRLNSRPLQMLSIGFLREACPELSASQGGLSGRQELQDVSKVLAKEIKDFSPAEIYERNVAMNAAGGTGIWLGKRGQGTRNRRFWTIGPGRGHTGQRSIYQ